MPQHVPEQQRVVITGMGAITALGHSVTATWEKLLAGQSGIDHITLFDATGFPTRFAGQTGKDKGEAATADAGPGPPTVPANANHGIENVRCDLGLRRFVRCQYYAK